MALLLTSWANSLSEASQHAAATHFESVFNASNALHIVVTDVLRQQPAEGSAVWNALISLLARVLYGDAALHNSLARHIVSLNSTLPQDSTRDECLKERAHAIAVLLSFLRDISANMRAYVEVLPASTSDHDLLSLQPPPPSAAPAGPDPTKAVERSMDAWRRAVARLQGHMALIVVLDKALIAADHTFECPPNLTFTHLKPFYDAVREAIKTHINSDLQERKRTLGSQHWTSVTKGADTTVFEAARVRAQSWLAQFEASRLEVESQLDDAGIGFGPSARVSESKFSVLVSASARVAALVSCHQHSFTWAKETTRLLTSMITAFRCLEKVGDGLLAPPAELRSTFFAGLEGAISAIDNVVNWSFASLHDKVLGSLEKSSSVTPTAGDTLPPLKPKQLRFEEPPKVIIHEPDGGIAGSAPVQSRRKPRHARMKSSPDALLHLNAHFDDYSDEDAEADRVVDREIECNEDRDSEQASFVGSTSNVDSDRSQGGSDADANEDKVGVPQVEELPVVYENQEYGEDDEDDDDRDIIVHEDMEESKPKKVNHTSHIRSMSVDGIPF